MTFSDDPYERISQLVKSGQLHMEARAQPVLYPAGNCVHCGQPIEETRLLEFLAGGGGQPRGVCGTGPERLADPYER